MPPSRCTGQPHLACQRRSTQHRLGRPRSEARLRPITSAMERVPSNATSWSRDLQVQQPSSSAHYSCEAAVCTPSIACHLLPSFAQIFHPASRRLPLLCNLSSSSNRWILFATDLRESLRTMHISKGPESRGYDIHMPANDSWSSSMRRARGSSTGEGGVWWYFRLGKTLFTT